MAPSSKVKGLKRERREAKMNKEPKGHTLKKAKAAQE